MRNNHYDVIVVGARVAGASTAILLARRGLYAFTWPRLKFFFVTALLGYLIPMATILYASNVLAAGMLALIISTAPLFTFAAAFFGRTEAISRLRLYALLLGLVATTLVLWPEFDAPGFGASGCRRENASSCRFSFAPFSDAATAA